MEKLTQCIKSVTDNFKLSDVKREMIYEDGGENTFFLDGIISMLFIKP